ncbi:MAG: RluA family pseudouridine synthase [Gammaproteobacteria bacterium]|nr:RluA family pseudouridine synthase [Gammaproteobacteria bacterium]
MACGAVWLQRSKTARRLRRGNAKLVAGDAVFLYYNEAVLAEEVEAPTLVADERSYSVWFKPYGMLSHGSKWGDHTAISRTVEKVLNDGRLAFQLHRLDRAASGLMILAHNKKAARALSSLFRDRAVDKHYLAMTHGRLPTPEVPVVIRTPVEERQAHTQASEVYFDESSRRSLLDVSIETGRKHQIRVHLSEIGLPIVGDRLFGPEGDSEDLQLLAYRLAFDCPLTQTPKEFLLPASLRPAWANQSASAA